MKKIIVAKNTLPIKVSYIKKKYQAKYLGDFAVKLKDGNWASRPVACFYQPNPNRELGHSEYFGIGLAAHFDGKEIIYSAPFIMSVKSVFSEDFTALELSDKILVSCYTHHFNQDVSGAFIDGGRDYTRYSRGEGEVIKLRMINGKFKKI